MNTTSLPTGTVTFLFTDIEGSTRLVQALGEDWLPVLDASHSLLHEAIAGRGGTVVNTEGDGVFAVFPDAIDGVRATVDAQRAVADHHWSIDDPIEIRMGLHTGHATFGGADYAGVDVHRAARIAATGHGGQTVLSQPTAVLVERDLPDGVTLSSLGEHRLKDLTEPEALFQLQVDGLRSDFPPLRTLDAIPNNLPVQLTSFVGRQRELEDVTGLIRATQMVTLTGPGGTGKTRLALQIGAQLSGDFDDGVFFVDLSPLTDVEVVPSEVLTALGVEGARADESPSLGLLDHLAGRELLLILDNFEHLIEGATLVADMARSAPRSRFLVTSRAPLRISGEQEYPVPPLTVSVDSDGDPSGLPDAMRLFEERASSVRPDFTLDEGNQVKVSELVQRLDGLPLAIELVTSRMRLLSVDAILERLNSRLLEQGAVDLPERQRTLDAAIGWSYDLLDGSSQRLFACLSVFAGPARLGEVEKVCGGDPIDLLQDLETLVQQSLIITTDTGDSPRFGMLHVIRQYASRKLTEGNEESEIRRRHLTTYTELAEEAAPHFQGSDRREWLNLMADSHDNLRAAIEWALETGDVDMIRRLSSASWRFWQARGHLHEARRRLESALALEGGDPHLRAKTLEALGGVLWWQGRPEECKSAYEAAVKLEREFGDPPDVANALYNYALAVGLATGTDKPEAAAEALVALDEAEGIYLEIEDFDGLGNTSWGRGLIAGLVSGDDETGLREWERSIDYYGRAKNEFGMGWSLFEMAWLRRRRGEPESAWPHLRSGLELFARHHDMSALVLFIAIAALVAGDLADERRAARLAGAFHTLRLQAGSEIMDHETTKVPELDLERLEALTGDLQNAYGEGREMDVDAAVAYTLAGPTDDH